MYKFSIVLLRIFFAICRFYSLKFIGTENIPSDGSILLAAKHQRYLDIIIVGLATKGRQVCFMAKESLFRFPLCRWYFKTVGTFPVKRNTADTSAIKTAVKILKNAGTVCIFPEGTRIAGNLVGDLQEGAATVASVAKTKVLPIGIHYILRWRFLIFPVLYVTLAYGKPIDPAEFGKDRTAVTEGIQKAIQSAQVEAVAYGLTCRP